MLRILIADDNADAVEMLAAILRIKGHEIAIAYDGIDALAAFERVRPDLVILDIGLPRLDGFAAAKQIRAMESVCATLLVALTGYSLESHRERAAAAGFDLYFVKPLLPEQMERLLAYCSTPSTS